MRENRFFGVSYCTIFARQLPQSERIQKKTWVFYSCSPHHQALAAIVKDKQRS